MNNSWVMLNGFSPFTWLCFQFLVATRRPPSSSLLHTFHNVLVGQDVKMSLECDEEDEERMMMIWKIEKDLYRISYLHGMLSS